MGEIARRLRPRPVVAAALAVLLTASSNSGGAESGVRSNEPAARTATGPSLVEAACALPKPVLKRLYNGWTEDRGGHVMLVPRDYNFVSGGLTHGAPVRYNSDIPMLWYGPGHIAARGSVGRVATLAGVAPTMAELLRFDFDAPDGAPMHEALAGGASPPRLIVVLVWDAGGRYVLNLWPNAWPYLRSLIPVGTWYERGTTGSAPTYTAPTHATIGTGAYARRHGMLENYVRWEDGTLADPWGRGPQGLLAETLADRYDAAMGNEPKVAAFGTTPWHLGMIGHGSYLANGDRDLAVLHPIPEGAGRDAPWGLNDSVAGFYEFPAYVNDRRPLSTYLRAADVIDGKQDGTWRGRDIQALGGGFDTPARLPYQTRAVEALVTQEGLGDDDVPDLLFLNYKLIDEIGHLWSASSIEMRDSLKMQDRQLKRLVGFLDTEVGAGQWAMLVTADHGHVAHPDVTGGFRIHSGSLTRRVEERFDVDTDEVGVVELLRPIWFNLRLAELEQGSATIEDVALFVQGLTKGDLVGDPSSVPAEQRDDRVFAAAIPGRMLDDLPCFVPPP